VNTGSDRVIDTFNTSLKAWVTDDGYTGQLSTNWTKVSGPGNVAFGNASNVNTTVSFSTTGTYVLRLTADDGSLTGYDEVQITVRNQPPVVNAGSDLSVTLPGPAFLNGTVSDDGQPGPLATEWSQISGPGRVNFADGGAVNTTATLTHTD